MLKRKPKNRNIKPIILFVSTNLKKYSIIVEARGIIGYKTLLYE
jgi:hypothetical protein